MWNYTTHCEQYGQLHYSRTSEKNHPQELAISLLDPTSWLPNSWPGHRRGLPSTQKCRLSAWSKTRRICFRAIVHQLLNLQRAKRAAPCTVADPGKGTAVMEDAHQQELWCSNTKWKLKSQYPQHLFNFFQRNKLTHTIFLLKINKI